MCSLLRRYGVCVLLNVVFVAIVDAELPGIGKAELIEAVKFGDSLHMNVDCKYSVDEEYHKKRGEDGKPGKRELEILWRNEGIREYIDVTLIDGGRYTSDKPFRFVMTHNGEGSKQWQPYANKGDIFKESYEHAWPVPTDFGMTLFKRDKKLGEALAECEITTLTQKECQERECYFVKAVQPDGAKVELFIDPEIGWRARRIRYWGWDGLIWYEASAEFKDCGNGTWFPVEGEFKLYGNDPSSGERVVSIHRRLTVEAVKVNADLTQEDFDIQFPQRTRVYDHIYGMGYVVGVTSLDGLDDATLDVITEAARAEQPDGNDIPVDGKGKR